MARFKEVAMLRKCPGNVSAEMLLQFGSGSCRGGSNESIVLFATPPHSKSMLRSGCDGKLVTNYDSAASFTMSLRISKNFRAGKDLVKKSASDVCLTRRMAQ